VTHTVTIDRGDIGVRIDRVLLRHLTHIPGVTRNRLQRLIANGAVHVNGRVIARASSRIAAGDALSIELPERRPRATPQAEAPPIDVRYEDEGLLVVNKPTGQVSHPTLRHESGTLLDGLVAHADQLWTPSLVSRLDKDTSGLVLVAKSRAMHAALQRLSAGNGIQKDYLTIVYGKPPSKGTIDLALDRDPWDRRRVAVRDRGGTASVTKFERLRTVALDPTQYLSLVSCRLVTGRMHQIRVHFAAKGWPIVGDRVYKGGVTHRYRSAAITRQALHAWRVAFVHPAKNVHVEVTAPLPPDMQQLVDVYFSSTRAQSRSTVPSAE
jgi:23S rRNA pseudouridine1911/1915/1917 synthase